MNEQKSTLTLYYANTNMLHPGVITHLSNGI
jgi:hypothetical protein